MKRRVNTENKEIDLTKNYQQGMELKPRGLWYAIDNEWIEWCEGNTDGWIRSGMIDLDIDHTKMLIIETGEQLKKLFNDFNYEICKGIKYVDWTKIAQNYSGIEIRNYHELKWGKHLPMMCETWFWAWDVSSGCIWDLSIIKSFNHCALEKNEKETCG